MKTVVISKINDGWQICLSVQRSGQPHIIRYTFPTLALAVKEAKILKACGFIYGKAS